MKNKQSLFEKGYLKSQFINPNYSRGLSEGWPCKHSTGSGWVGDYLLAKKKNGYNSWLKYGEEAEMDLIRIPKFTPKDIPVGELCWFGDGDNLELLRLDFYDKTANYQYRSKCGFNYYFCIPFLIAETPERAQWILDNTDWNDL